MDVWPSKDPQAVEPGYVDWTEWLVAGETIVTSTWDIQGNVVKDSEDLSGGLAKIVLSGGTLGEVCIITNHVVTSLGREEDHTVKLRIRNH